MRPHGPRGLTAEKLSVSADAEFPMILICMAGLGRLFDFIKERGEWDRTMIVFTAVRHSCLVMTCSAR